MDRGTVGSLRGSEAEVSDTRQNANIGVWLIGAFGGVGTTVAMGISALKHGVTSTTALATDMDCFRHLDFPSFESLVVGGHDVRRSCFRKEAGELHEKTGVFTDTMIQQCGPDLEAWSQNVRPGILWQSGKPVEKFADWASVTKSATPWSLVTRLADDLRQFSQQHQLAHVVVVNVSSSEPMPPVGAEHESWAALQRAVQTKGSLAVPASSLYGLAACEAGCSYVNFTPSLGLDSPALEERAREASILYMGKDGKSGETLMKAVLAPMFVRRNLEVLSWVGHNILGNRDGLVLQDPANKQGKVESKGHLISEILGYEPQTLVTIEHIESLADWKTAWDHIHFRGFLGAKMSLQFIWQGCDSLLAAPMAIDLVRWTELARRRNETGCMTHLASYFKTPMNVAEQDFFRQWQQLCDYAACSKTRKRGQK